MIETDNTSKRIVKNTIMLYIRMIVSVCVNLYTSRILLRYLGIDDFGIYSLVGGVIALMAFLNTSMSGSSSRFIAYELGRGDLDTLSRTFSASLLSHIFIAILVLIIGETLGLWFVNNYLVIPAERYYATHILYQLSLLISIISFLQVPFSATAIAHEKFDAYSIIEISNVALKLGMVLILSIIKADRLIIYPMLLLIVALIIFISYIYYCKHSFPEVNFSFEINENYLFPMLKFSGWDIYGNGCVVIGQQGANILMNRFFGIAINASIGVANQASSAVLMFVSNITMALRPPIIKLYASHNIKEMQNLLVIAIVICIAMAEVICLPLCMRIRPIMALWLTDVPAYASEFCWWMLIINGISVVNPLLVSVIHATGNIKKISTITGTLYLFSLLFACIAYYIFDNPVITYKLSVLISIFVIISNICIIKRQIPEVSLVYLCKSILLPVIILVFTVIINVILGNFIPETLWSFFVIFIVNFIILASLLALLWFLPKVGWKLKVYKLK